MIEIGVVVVFVDYWCFFEMCFFGVFEDVFVVMWDIIGCIVEFGVDVKCVGVVGDSVGGNFVVVIVIVCCDVGIVFVG